MRLLEQRYDVETDEVTITADRCPLRQQNYDYAMYLLTALFHESWVTLMVILSPKTTHKLHTNKATRAWPQGKVHKPGYAISLVVNPLFTSPIKFL